MRSNCRRAKLSELGRIVTGKTPPTADTNNFGGPVPFLTPSDFIDKHRRVTTTRTLSAAGLNTVKNCLVSRGVAVSCIGWQMGKAVLVDEPTVTNQQINTLVPSEHLIDREYLYYVLVNLEPKIFQLGATSTRTPIVNKTTFGAIEIDVPPIEEQREVAAVLSALDNRIDLLRQTNITLESMARAVFKSWFIDFDPVLAKAEGREPEGMDAATAALFPAEFEESPRGLIPKGWGISEVGQMAQCVGGGTPSTKEPAFWEPGVHHWATPKDLSGLEAPVLLDTERRLSDAGLAKVGSGLLPAGTLLMSSRAPIGYLALAQVPVAVNQGFIAMRPGGKLSPRYLYFWCQANMDAIKQKANGSTFMEISKTAFRPITLVVPSQRVVERFGELVGAIFERIADGERYRVRLEELRDTLLPRLISGKHRLPETAEQIEEATA